MTLEERQRKIGRVSFLIALGISLVLAGAFYGAATFLGSYPLVARYGGAAWVFLLSLIIGMPTITTVVKRKIKV